MKMEFDWDEVKEATNRRKHGITFEEAENVFAEPPVVVFDSIHSTDELRFFAVGHSSKNRLLTVSFTYRGAVDQVIRIIGARRSTSDEARFYAEKKAQQSHA